MDLVVKDECVVIKFDKKYYGLLRELQQLRMAIVDMSSLNNSIPVGISPYTVTKHDKQNITLSLSKFTKENPKFKKIIISVVEKDKIKVDKLIKYHEINLLSPDQPPNKKDLLSNFDVYKTFDLVNTYILLEYPDKRVRKIIKNCLDRLTFANTLGKEIFRKMEHYLPRAISTAEKFKQNCTNIAPLKNALEITFSYYWNPSLKNNIEQSLKKSLAKYNIKPKLKNIDKKKLAGIMSNKIKAYEAMIVGISGTDAWNYLHVLGLDSNNKSLISFRPSNEKQLQEYLTNGSKKQRKIAVSDFFKQLDKEDILVPIVEHARSVYYPKGMSITNDNTSMFLSEYQIKYLE